VVRKCVNQIRRKFAAGNAHFFLRTLFPEDGFPNELKWQRNTEELLEKKTFELKNKEIKTKEVFGTLHIEEVNLEVMLLVSSDH